MGVADNGEIVGIEQQYVQKIKKELTNALNNSQLINPPFLFNLMRLKSTIRPFCSCLFLKALKFTVPGD